MLAQLRACWTASFTQRPSGGGRGGIGRNWYCHQRGWKSGTGALFGVAGHAGGGRHSPGRSDRHCQGHATTTNYRAAPGAFGGSAAGCLSGFSRTPEGKATVAASVDAYNGMMISRCDYKARDVNGGLGRVGALKVN